jgi:hypothetical protein
VHLGNLFRQVRAQPHEPTKLVDAFLKGLAFAGDDTPSFDALAAVRDAILPVLRAADYVAKGNPGSYMPSMFHGRWANVCAGTRPFFRAAHRPR